MTDGTHEDEEAQRLGVPLDALVIRQVEQTLKNCYMKHVKMDDSIGWDELGDEIFNTLCNLIGDDAFVEWNEKK